MVRAWLGLIAAVILMPRGACGAAVSAPVPMLESFSLAEVRLLDGPFKRAEELERAYLLSLDPDRFLYHFRVNAGIPTTARPYGGWEAPDWDFHGHILGHYLSACAQMAAHGGEPEFQRRVDYIVGALAECQAALARTASHPGFLDPQPEAVFARLERGEAVDGVPYYTMHKTLAGLLDAYTLAHNPQALAVLNGMADWMKFRLDRLTEAQVQNALRIEHGGINESFANLYAITGNPDHLRLAERLNHELFFAPFARGVDMLGPGPGPAGARLIHANTQVPKAIGAAREYELTANPTYRAVAENFWRDVAQTRSFIIGGNSDQEHFFARGTDARHLTPRTAEFCNTYNMLKLTRHLFAWAPSAALMDFYERALYNHVLAAQNPDTGMNTYFTSLEPGGRKRFGTPDNTFWCCTGTSMEQDTKLADSIYFHGAGAAIGPSAGDEALYVNLFIASELRWRELGLRLRQTTNFPAADTTELTFTLATPRHLALRIRDPYWAGPVAVEVNGGPVSFTSASNGYVTIDREWHDGDRVAVRLPMGVRAVSLPETTDEVAFMYGPLVLAGDLGNAGLRFKPEEFVDNGKDPRGPRVPESPAFVPGLVGRPGDLAAQVRPVPGASLTFRTVGLGRPRDVTLVPLSAIVGDYYTVYWRVYDEAAWRRHWAAAEPGLAADAAAEAKISDAVWAGLPASEAAHGVVSVGAPVVSSRLSLYREATHGSVSWNLAAPAAGPLALRVGYLGADAAAFEVWVNGQRIARVAPVVPAPARPNDARVTTIETFPVPVSVSAGKPTLNVRFVGIPDSGPARIVFCELLRAANSNPSL